LTLEANLSPSFVNAGYSFVGWSTLPGGGGTTFNNGSVYSFSSDITLYAQWTAPFHSVTFVENDSPSDVVVSQQSANSAEALTNFVSLSPSFSNSGKAFSGWTTNADGTGTTYSDGATYSFGSDLDLYAKWTSTAHTVTFHQNDTALDATTVTQIAGAATTLNAFANLTPAFTNPGFNFTGWNTSSSGSGTAYANGANYGFNSDLNLYAQWSAMVAPPTSGGTTPPNTTPTTTLPKNLIVTFNSGGSSPVISSQSIVAGSHLTLPVASSQSHGTFTQTGWFTAVFGGSFIGRSGSVITPTSTETLFAQWALSTQTGKQALLVGAIGPFVVNSSALGATLKAQVRDIALGMRSKGYAVATTYGFSVPSERQLGKTLSARRAASVATYLRSVLASLHVKAVAMHSAGEGSVHGATKALNRRVEIFLTL
jgi:hypothetical protein